VIACHNPGCWLAMMGFQLINGHLVATVPVLTEPKDHPVWPAQGYSNNSIREFTHQALTLMHRTNWQKIFLNEPFGQPVAQTAFLRCAAAANFCRSAFSVNAAPI
jgi:hypothetical protein